MHAGLVSLVLNLKKGLVSSDSVFYVMTSLKLHDTIGIAPKPSPCGRYYWDEIMLIPFKDERRSRTLQAAPRMCMVF